MQSFYHILSSSLSWSLLLLLLPSSTIAQTCYWPDGAVASWYNYTFFPCTGSAVSACCIKELHTCVDHGLCLYQNTYARVACTDQSWNSDACPKYCLSRK